MINHENKGMVILGRPRERRRIHRKSTFEFLWFFNVPPRRESVKEKRRYLVDTFSESDEAIVFPSMNVGMVVALFYCKGFCKIEPIFLTKGIIFYLYD